MFDLGKKFKICNRTPDLNRPEKLDLGSQPCQMNGRPLKNKGTQRQECHLSEKHPSPPKGTSVMNYYFHAYRRMYTHRGKKLKLENPFKNWNRRSWQYTYRYGSRWNSEGIQEDLEIINREIIAERWEPINWPNQIVQVQKNKCGIKTWSFMGQWKRWGQKDMKKLENREDTVYTQI